MNFNEYLICDFHGNKTMVYSSVCGLVKPSVVCICYNSGFQIIQHEWQASNKTHNSHKKDILICHSSRIVDIYFQSRNFYYT